MSDQDTVVLYLLNAAKDAESQMNIHHKKGDTLMEEFYFQTAQGILSRVSDQDYQRFKHYL